MKVVVDIGAVRDVPLPQEGEVWLCVETGYLYEMRGSRGEPYRIAHRVGAPESHYGCDPTVSVACWDSAVSEGRWVRVYNCPRFVESDVGVEEKP